MLLSFFEGHNLDEEVPLREVAPSDGVVQVTDGVVGVLAREVCGLACRQVLNTLCSLQ